MHEQRLACVRRFERRALIALTLLVAGLIAWGIWENRTVLSALAGA